MTSVLRVGDSCYWQGPVARSAVIVDAAAYYAALYHACSLARHQIVMAGWQFDTNVKLLRGAAARDAPYPVEFLPFLNALCAERPELRIFLLAWDYSLVYSLEREWLQGLKFDFQSSEAIRFEFDAHPNFGGSHHQKFAVIDGHLAFVGGLDVCDERWDDRRHVIPHELRVNVSGAPCRPNHEVQSLVQGEPARVLQGLFVERWRAALGETLVFPAGTSAALSELDLAAIDRSAILPLRAESVAIARTLPPPAATRELRSVCCSALLAAEELLYAETQYFTSRSLTAALLARLRDVERRRLQVLILMPRGADNSKEKFALGDLQSAVLSELQQAADDHGHQLRFLCSSVAGEDCDAMTFIHSKLLIVDDQLLYVGSANFTERSMTLDSELGLVWQAQPGADLCHDIRNLRASLLSEHSGQSPAELLDPRGLVQRLDAAMQSGKSRLRVSRFEPASVNPIKRAIFDPSAPDELAPEEG